VVRLLGAVFQIEGHGDDLCCSKRMRLASH
jgi:hypothetical protein